MSFNSWNDLERTATNASTKYSDYPEFGTRTSAIERELSNINDLLLVLKNGYDATKILSITDAFKVLNTDVLELNKYVLDIEASHEDVEVVSYFKQKEGILVKMTRDSLQRFKQQQQRQEQRQVVLLEEQLQQQQQQREPQSQLSIQIVYEPLNAEQLEQQSISIAQREQEIHQIQQDTLQINEIFENLLSIVNEQQFQIDSIENNIFNYSGNVTGASSELRKAERYQKRAGGRMFCCLVILVGVFGFIVLVSLI